MTNPHYRLTQIPDAMMAAFARGAAHCGGKTLQDFETQPPAQLPYHDVSRDWAAITQKPVAAHTIAQLRWVICDEDNALFRRAELEHSYYVRRDAAQLKQLRLVLGQVTNVLHAQGAIEASAVESLQNRFTDIENEVLASSDLRDWSWGNIALTGALWVGGVAGLLLNLTLAFGVLVPIATHKWVPVVTQTSDKVSKKWRSWWDKNDNDPKPPSASGGAGAETVVSSDKPGLHVVPRTAIAPATPPAWKGWDPSATGHAQDDWAGTLLTGIVVYVALPALAPLGEWELPEFFSPILAPAL